MKDWIQEHYDDNLRGYDELRAAIIAAWEAVPPAYLLELLESMPARCQAVIDANSMHTCQPIFLTVAYYCALLPIITYFYLLICYSTNPAQEG
jgi:hypothetical protein